MNKKLCAIIAPVLFSFAVSASPVLPTCGLTSQMHGLKNYVAIQKEQKWVNSNVITIKVINCSESVVITANEKPQTDNPIKLGVHSAIN
jgi:hypothetical protein